jgi:hypothetical protein
MAFDSLFCARCIRNTMRKVTIVVPVWITSCRLSPTPSRTKPIRKSAKATGQRRLIAAFPWRRRIRPIPMGVKDRSYRNGSRG